MIRLFHASLHDFLTNSTRSKGLFINPTLVHFTLLLGCITTIPNYWETVSRTTIYACKSRCYHNLALGHGGDYIQEPENSLLLVHGRVMRPLFKHWVTDVGGSDRLRLLVELNLVLSKLKISHYF